VLSALNDRTRETGRAVGESEGRGEGGGASRGASDSAIRGSKNAPIGSSIYMNAEFVLLNTATTCARGGGGVSLVAATPVAVAEAMCRSTRSTLSWVLKNMFQTIPVAIIPPPRPAA
jgi:hypothetical protein